MPELEPTNKPDDEEEVIQDNLEDVEPGEPEEDLAPEESEDEEPADDEPAAPEKEAKQPSRRESLRIQKLVSKLREQRESRDEEQPVKTGMDYKTALDADDEVVDKLEQDRKSYGQAQYEQGLRRAESMQFHTRLEIDAPRVDAKYPIFDKGSDDFKPQVADAVNQFYLGMVGFDPKSNTVEHANVRYADFVDSLMELANEIAGEKTGSTTRRIARQAATTGIRPDGSAARMNLNKLPSQMTDKELDAIIAQAIPNKR